jgi:hypothetical protein
VQVLPNSSRAKRGALPGCIRSGHALTTEARCDAAMRAAAGSSVGRAAMR